MLTSIISLFAEAAFCRLSAELGILLRCCNAQKYAERLYYPTKREKMAQNQFCPILTKFDAGSSKVLSIHSAILPASPIYDATLED